MVSAHDVWGTQTGTASTEADGDTTCVTTRRPYPPACSQYALDRCIAWDLPAWNSDNAPCVEITPLHCMKTKLRIFISTARYAEEVIKQSSWAYLDQFTPHHLSIPALGKEQLQGCPDPKETGRRVWRRSCMRAESLAGPTIGIRTG